MASLWNCFESKINVYSFVLLWSLMSLQTDIVKSSPACGDATITRDNLNFTVTCLSEWGQGITSCTFTLFSPGSGDQSRETRINSVDYVKYDVEKENRVMIRTRTICTLSYPLSILSGQGDRTYRIRVHIVWKYDGNPETKSVTSNKALVLESRGARISLYACPVGESGKDNVKDGYIKVNTTATCSCKLDRVGSPPAYITWYDGGHRIGGNSPHDDKSAILKVGPHETNSNFSCQAISPIGEVKLHFSPKFAKGPRKIWARHSLLDAKTLDMCGQDFPGLTFVCWVSLKDASPTPLVYLYHQWSGDESRIKKCSEGLDLHMRDGTATCQSTIQTPEPGYHAVTCVGENAIFGEIKVFDKTEIYVRAPPEEPPTVRVLIQRSGQIVHTFEEKGKVEGDTPPNTTDSINVTATENDDVLIQCTAKGGEPAVTPSDFSLLCQGRYKTVQKSGRYLLLKKVGRAENGLVCTCTVSHITNCYENAVSVPKTIRVLQTTPTSIVEEKPGDGDSAVDNQTPVIIGIVSCLGFIAVIVIIVIIRRRKGGCRIKSSGAEDDGDVVVIDNSTLYYSHHEVEESAYCEIQDLQPDNSGHDQGSGDIQEQMMKDPDLVIIDNWALYGGPQRVITDDEKPLENDYCKIDEICLRTTDASLQETAKDPY